LTHLHTVKGGSDLGSSKRKTHVAGFSSSDGVHGKTTGFVGSSGKGSLSVNIHGSTLEKRSLRIIRRRGVGWRGGGIGKV
jgi:hypothetical protein